MTSAGPLGGHDPGSPGPATAVERIFREHHGAVLATLIRHVGDFELAEDALQDAVAAALVSWPRDGVPDEPRAWILVTARRRAIDRIRRGRSLADRTARLADLKRLEPRHQEGHDVEPDTSSIDDDQLRLMFTCCHPALSMPARVALTLRSLGGMTTPEIARSFLTSETTMAQRLVRAKRKIASAGIPYAVPSDADLDDRLPGVLQVLYLIFNEGYSPAGGDLVVRTDLCHEAIRLARLLDRLMPDAPEVAGLLALMLLTDARRPARVDPSGASVPLDHQDRSRWDRARLRDGIETLDRAARRRELGPYQVQAAIAATHAQARTVEQTDWAAIAHLYATLHAMTPTPVVAINWAVAVAFAGDHDRGLAMLAPLATDTTIADYQPLHVARAELLGRAGDLGAAGEAYERAIELSSNARQRADLERRRDDLAARRPG